MPFFADNGSYSSGGGDYELGDDGLYICRLKEIESLMQPSYDDANIMEPKYKWVFESVEEMDSTGNPFRFVNFTKRKYGHEKAAITILLDGMLGKHLTNEEFNALDLDALMAKKYRVSVELTKSGTGKDINKILWVKPPKPASSNKMGEFGANRSVAPAKASVAASAAGSDGDDPFDE